MDGVICTPFLGTNIAISRELDLPPQPDSGSVREFGSERRRRYVNMRRRLEDVRYVGRHPLPGVKEGLEALAAIRQPVLITGRSFHARHIIEHWLARHDLLKYFSQLVPNNTNLSTAHFKLWTAQKVGHPRARGR